MAFLIAWSISSAVMRTIILLVATLVRDYRQSCSGNIVWNVQNYVEVGITKREVGAFHAHLRLQCAGYSDRMHAWGGGESSHAS
jgi:hypothetical protein